MDSSVEAGQRSPTLWEVLQEVWYLGISVLAVVFAVWRCVRSVRFPRLQVAAPIVQATSGCIDTVHTLRQAAKNSDPKGKELARRQQVASRAFEIQQDQAGTSGAEYLHSEIRADYWGITWQGFEDFMATVRANLASGGLTNTGRVEYAAERFDSAAVGPNMYQVNEQVIVPLTKVHSKYPGASWAFRGDCVGTLVTIFVTHAWQEGVFEFEKLLAQGWPLLHGKRSGAAYICFLSNPQNLDIGAMLDRIETSPFKVALDGMPKPGCMIMCGTLNGAIHERAWCVFEAFTAIEQEIPIIVPGMGTELASVDNRLGVESEAAALQRLQQSHMRRQNAGAGNGMAGPDPLFGLIYCLCCVACAFFRSDETASAIREAEANASNGHLVDVGNAQCTKASDQAKIREAIAGKEHQINRLVAMCIMKAAAARVAAGP